MGERRGGGQGYNCRSGPSNVAGSPRDAETADRPRPRSRWPSKRSSPRRSEPSRSRTTNSTASSRRATRCPGQGGAAAGSAGRRFGTHALPLIDERCSRRCPVQDTGRPRPAGADRVRGAAANGDARPHRRRGFGAVEFCSGTMPCADAGRGAPAAEDLAQVPGPGDGPRRRPGRLETMTDRILPGPGHEDQPPAAGPHAPDQQYRGAAHPLGPVLVRPCGCSAGPPGPAPAAVWASAEALAWTLLKTDGTTTAHAAAGERRVPVVLKAPKR